MNNFDLMKNQEDFRNALENNELHNKQNIIKAYNELYDQFERLLMHLHDKEYVNLTEFKEYLGTKYSNCNFDSFFKIIEEYNKYYATKEIENYDY